MQFSMDNLGARKLTSEQVAEIRQHYAEGATQGALARHFKVTIGTIGRIVRGESWQGGIRQRDRSGLDGYGASPEVQAQLDLLKQAGLGGAIAQQVAGLPPKPAVPVSVLDGGEPPDETRGTGIEALMRERALALGAKE